MIHESTRAEQDDLNVVTWTRSRFPQLYVILLSGWLDAGKKSRHYTEIAWEDGSTLDEFMAAALQEAEKGRDEGGIPIGSVLVIDGKIVGRGHNRRVQQGSAILHAEIDCLENSGRLKAGDYRRATLYSTLSPCDMCSGAALLYKIPKIVAGENETFQGPEVYLQSRGIIVEIQYNQECVQLMREFIAEHPELWNEDIGE